MRHILIIIFLFFILVKTSAKCGYNGIYCINNSATIAKNELIILEFYASSQELVKDLNIKYPIYLKASKAKVTLEIIEILKGQYGLTEVILKPKNELKINQDYSLQIDNLPKFETKPKLTFKVTNDNDTIPLILIGNPIETEKSFQRLGCGPSVWVHFTLLGQQDHNSFVRTTVRNVKTGVKSTYVLRLENGIIKIGHNMCSGAFSFVEGDNYEATFQLVDKAGNKSKNVKTVLFTAPISETKDD